MNSDLLRLRELSRNLPLVVKVSPSVFCVFGNYSSNNPAGYFQVRVRKILSDVVLRTVEPFCSKDK